MKDTGDMASRNRWALSTLFIVIMIDAMGVSLIYPIMPSLFLKPIGILGPTVATASRDFWYAFSLSVFPVGMLLGMPLVGTFSDWFGRKKMMLFCLFGTAVGYLICVLGIGAHSMWVFFAGRFFTGMCASSSAIAMAAIADISANTEEEVGNMGWPMVAQLGGFIIGPLVSGFALPKVIQTTNEFFVPFFIAAGIAVANAMLLLFTFKETLDHLERKSSLWDGFKDFKFIAFDRRVRLLALLYLFIQVGIQDYLQSISLILAQDYSYSNGQLSIFFAVTGLATAFAVVVVQPVITRLTSPRRLEGMELDKQRKIISRLGIEASSFWFCILTGLILIAAGIVPGVAWQWAFSLAVGCLSTLIGMRFMAVFSSAVTPEEQGKVMGGVGAVLALSLVIASNDIGEMMKFSYHWLLIGGGIFVLIPTLFVRRPIRRALGGGELEIGEAAGADAGR